MGVTLQSWPCNVKCTSHFWSPGLFNTTVQGLLGLIPRASEQSKYEAKDCRVASNCSVLQNF